MRKKLTQKYYIAYIAANYYVQEYHYKVMHLMYHKWLGKIFYRQKYKGDTRKNYYFT